MTDNLNESNATKANTDNVNASSTSHSNAWQLNALTAALGDLNLTVSDSLSIGRGSDNDVVLGSKAVSRNHAVLSVLNAELYVKDLDSSNGTFVNGQRIDGNQSVLLKDEDKLGFASFEFQVMAQAKEQVATPAIDPVTEVAEDKEPEEIVGAVQENLESDANTNTSPVTEPTIEPSVPVAAVEEPIQETPRADREAVSADTEAQPVVKETIIDEVLSASAGQEAISETSAASVEEDIVPAADTHTLPAAATEETLMADDKSATETVIEQPVVAEPIADAPVAKETVTKEPIVDEPATEAKLMPKKADHKEPVISAEQDKTTTTALQEEADPDVLRAKQAATAQFSGTANLGQGRDLGTAGNNAMDQAIDNPASSGQSEKKASGGWFIWVFIAVLIIGVALWLFNMGGA